MNDEYQRSHREGFERLWNVAKSYQVRDGMLFVAPWQEGSARSYAPAAHPQVATELAALSGGDPVLVLKFAQKWGHLGRQDLAGPNRVVELHEPLDWIQAHARGVSVCLALAHYLKADDSARLRSFLESLKGELPMLPLQKIGFTESKRPTAVLNFGNLDRDKIVAWQIHDPVATAHEVIMSVVNANVGGIAPELQRTDSDLGVILGRRFSALIEIIYWHLAHFVEGELEVGTCQDCGRPFHKTHGHQRYCPPEPFAESDSESLCSKRARMRRLRQKQRQSKQLAPQSS